MRSHKICFDLEIWIIIPKLSLLPLFIWSTAPLTLMCYNPVERTKIRTTSPGPEVIKLFSCSTQLSMKFFLFINIKMPTIVGILTVMRGKNSILG